MGLRKRLRDFRDWCPQPPGRLPTKLKRYSMPIAAAVMATLILSVSFFVFSSSLISSVPIVPLVNVQSSTTPAVLWNYSTGGEVFSSPVVDDGIVYVGSSNGNVCALNATNGAQLWNSSGSYPAVANGVVYVGTGFSVDALNATSGAQLWSNSPLTNNLVDYSPSVVVGEVVYTSTTALAGFLFALNAKTGNELWSKSIGPSEFWSSPAVVNGVVYVGTEEYTLNRNNGVYALNAKNGGQLWNYSSGYSVEASPVVVGGVVYFVTDNGDLYALSAKTGLDIWNSALFGVGDSSPAVVGGVVYVGSEDGNVYALNATSGAKLWNYTTGNGTLSTPAVVGGIVYVGSSDGNIYALDEASGAKLWSYNTIGAVGSPVVVNGILYVGGGESVYALRVSPATSASPKPSSTLPIIIGVIVALLIVAIFALLIFQKKLKTKTISPPNAPHSTSISSVQIHKEKMAGE